MMARKEAVILSSLFSVILFCNSYYLYMDQYKSSSLPIQVYNNNDTEWDVGKFTYHIYDSSSLIYSGDFEPVTVPPKSSSKYELPILVNNVNNLVEYKVVLASSSGTEFYRTTIIR